MNPAQKVAPLNTFLWYCNQSPLEKTVLDCGAGGSCPPLFLFYEAGYQTLGLEISDERLNMVTQFENERGIHLHVQKGDMRQIPFDTESISFVYSFNSIFHMERQGIIQSIREIHRVMITKGLCFINFLSIDDEEYGKGVKIAPRTFLQDEDGGKTVHTYFKDDEGDALFAGFYLLNKEKRIVELWRDQKIHRMVFLDYIVQKLS